MELYDHYIAMDWSMKEVAIARMTGKSNKITVVEAPSDVTEVKVYLESLKGSKILAIEETTTAQWLYTEFKDRVKRIVICDPCRNRLLSEGPKTDKIDATKLVRLLRSDLLKEVYHSTDRFVQLRRLVSGYEDLVKGGVRLKNQRHALLRACGQQNQSEQMGLDKPLEQFVLKKLDHQIQVYEDEKDSYVDEFRKLSRRYPEINHQRSLPGLDYINAVKVVARVVSPQRFADKGHYLSYCGLVKLDKMSGGRSYGKKNPRYCRQLKSVYKTAALAAIGGNNPINEYYEYLIEKKGYPDYTARHAVSRRLAILSLGIFKSKSKYEPYRRKHVNRTVEYSSDL